MIAKHCSDCLGVMTGRPWVRLHLACLHAYAFVWEIDFYLIRMHGAYVGRCRIAEDRADDRAC